MAGLTESNVIDLVGQGPDGTGILAIIESRPWGADPAQPSQLRAKLDTYVRSVLDGGLFSTYPELKGRPLLLRVDCLAFPTEDLVNIINEARDRLSTSGFQVSVKINPDLSPTS